MTAYCNQADLIAAISSQTVAQLSDDVGGVTIDATNVDAAIEKADKFINLLCRKNFTVPWTTVPEPIGEISIDLSVQNLYYRRSNIEATEALQRRWKESMTMLKAIAAGKIQIDDDESFSNTASVWGTSNTSGSKLYDDDYLDTFQADE